MDFDRQLDLQAVLDGLGQGVLIFDSAGRLVLDNLAARALLGTDLKLIRSEGWTAAAVLFNSGHHDPSVNIDAARRQALDSARPVRFHTYRAGEYVPCWAAIVPGRGGDLCTMITIDAPDWAIINDLIGRFRSEVMDAAEATQGHLSLINQSISRLRPDEPIGHLIKRIGGFNRLIATHTYRTASLMELLGRLEALRTGTLRTDVRASRQRIALDNFIEDFIESLDEITLLDPESEPHDFRGRLKVSVPPGLAVSAAPAQLTAVLRDVLRNAIMYSMKATPVYITVMAVAQGQSVQIDVVDEGYGIRAREQDRVFQPFQRSRQPQIIGEFGYGLSLYLCKHEVEVMGGGMWFKSEESVGSTFSIKLPAWRETSDDALPARP